MTDDPILIHIGYHKTGTSWLQSCLFTNPNLRFRYIHTKHHVKDYIIAPHPLTFDPTVAKNYLSQISERVTAGTIPMISSERLCGSIRTGGSDSKEISIRLRDIFPNAKILIAIREQYAIILSSYNTYILTGGTLSFRQFINQMKSDSSWWEFAPKLEHFKYIALIQQYIKLYGSENVCVLAYEQFFTDPESYIRKIMEFSQHPIEDVMLGSLPYQQRFNESYSVYGLDAVMRFNQFVKFINRDNKNKPVLKANRRKVAHIVDKFIPKELQKRSKHSRYVWLTDQIGSYYAESNAQLANLTGLPLDRWGYQLPR